MVQVRLVLLVHAHYYVAQLFIVFNKLMISLGDAEYVTRGGDLDYEARNPHTAPPFGLWH